MPHEFTDESGRAWSIVLNKGTVRKLWDLLHLNLHDPAHISRLCNQERYLLLPQVFTVLCRQEGERVWPDAAGQPAALLDRFDTVLQDDTIFDAAHAEFCKEFADFCRSRSRPALAKYLDSVPRLLAKETAVNLSQLPDPAKVEADLDARLSVNPQPSPTRGDSSTTTLERSEASTQSP